MLDFLPSVDDAYRKSIENYGEVLETIIIEDIFMPEIIKLLSGINTAFAGGGDALITAGSKWAAGAVKFVSGKLPNGGRESQQGDRN